MLTITATPALGRTRERHASGEERHASGARTRHAVSKRAGGFRLVAGPAIPMRVKV